MTKETQETIIRLKNSGMTLKAIADTTKLSVNTIKSFFQRRGKKELQVNEMDRCKNCGEVLHHTPGRRKKIYCSSRCRMQWWNGHQTPAARKMLVPITCAFCGTEFMDYPSKHRKYCSGECYFKARFGQ